jgi:uncharacterized RDD family membrane protein YckC
VPDTARPSAGSSAAAWPAAGLRRRLAAMLYEGVILFGVLMVAGLVYSPIAQQRHALQGRHGLQAFVFLVLAAYFIGFWSHGGQTIAAKTWQVRVITQEGTPLTLWRACARFLLAWLWFLPALLVCAAMGWHDSRTLYGALAVGMLAYGVLGRLLPGRQFLHDHLCHTRLARTPIQARTA